METVWEIIYVQSKVSREGQPDGSIKETETLWSYPVVFYGGKPMGILRSFKIEIDEKLICPVISFERVLCNDYSIKTMTQDEYDKWWKEVRSPELRAKEELDKG